MTKRQAKRLAALISRQSGVYEPKALVRRKRGDVGVLVVRTLTGAKYLLTEESHWNGTEPQVSSFNKRHETPDQEHQRERRRERRRSPLDKPKREMSGHAFETANICSVCRGILTRDGHFHSRLANYGKLSGAAEPVCCPCATKAGHVCSFKGIENLPQQKQRRYRCSRCKREKPFAQMSSETLCAFCQIHTSA